MGMGGQGRECWNSQCKASKAGVSLTRAELARRAGTQGISSRGRGHKRRVIMAAR